MLAVTIATLTLSGSPPVLKGAHFKPHELVRVFVPGPSGQITVRATYTGTFLVHLPETPQKAVILKAIGARGSKASIPFGIAQYGDPTK